MHSDGVNIRINQGCGRTFEVRLAVAAFCEAPCFTTIVRTERAADFDCRIRACAMKSKAAHTSGFRRIWQHPAVLIAHLRDLGTLAPTQGAVVRNEDRGGFRPHEFVIRETRMKRHPAHVPRMESIAGHVPLLTRVIRPKNAVGRPGENHALARNGARDVLTIQAARACAPLMFVAFVRKNSVPRRNDESGVHSFPFLLISPRSDCTQSSAAMRPS